MQSRIPAEISHTSGYKKIFACSDRSIVLHPPSKRWRRPRLRRLVEYVRLPVTILPLKFWPSPNRRLTVRVCLTWTGSCSVVRTVLCRTRDDYKGARGGRGPSEIFVAPKKFKIRPPLAKILLKL